MGIVAYSGTCCATAKPYVADGGDRDFRVRGRLVAAPYPRDPASEVPDSVIRNAVEANNAFAVDLYAHILAEQSAAGESNVITSPISASLSLTMAYAGASGQTAREMASALHFGGASASIFNGQNALSQALASRGPSALATAERRLACSNSPCRLRTISGSMSSTRFGVRSPTLGILRS